MSAEAWSALWVVTFDTWKLLLAGGAVGWMMRGEYTKARQERKEQR